MPIRLLMLTSQGWSTYAERRFEEAYAAGYELIHTVRVPTHFHGQLLFENTVLIFKGENPDFRWPT